MADEIKTIVRQDSYLVSPEGSVGKIRLNPRGEVVGIDQYQQWVFDGRVFMASNAVRETPTPCGTASATFADDDPAFLLDVPNGATAVPLEITLNTAGTVGGGVIRVLITLSDKTRYSSGGTAITRQNMRFDEPRTSKCPFYDGTSDITAASNDDDITLYAAYLDPDVSTAPHGTPTRIHWSAKNFIAPVLIGPASLVIYTYSASTQPSWFYCIKWAEFDTVEVT